MMQAFTLKFADREQYEHVLAGDDTLKHEKVGRIVASPGVFNEELDDWEMPPEFAFGFFAVLYADEVPEHLQVHHDPDTKLREIA